MSEYQEADSTDGVSPSSALACFTLLVLEEEDATPQEIEFGLYQNALEILCQVNTDPPLPLSLCSHSHWGEIRK